jgi:hypothetical protein
MLQLGLTVIAVQQCMKLLLLYLLHELPQSAVALLSMQQHHMHMQLLLITHNLTSIAAAAAAAITVGGQPTIPLQLWRCQGDFWPGDVTLQILHKEPEE